MKYDIILHLTGEQLGPNYMAIKLFESEKHLFVKTKTTKDKVDVLKKIFRDKKEIYSFETEPTDFRKIVEDLKSAIADRCADATTIGFNVTGGTKIMSFAAYEVSLEDDRIVPFYIDTQKRKIHFLKSPFEIIDLPPAFESVDEFFQLAGVETQRVEEKKGFSPTKVLTQAKRNLLEEIWKNRKIVKEFNYHFSMVSDNFKKSGKNGALPSYKNVIASLEKQSPKVVAFLRNVFNIENDFLEVSSFMCGIWFEEWLLMQIENNGYRDLRQSIHLKVKDNKNKSDKDYQELDLAMTDGYTLTIIECKTTNKIEQDVFQKLENLQKKLGGVFGRAFLTSCFIPENNGDIADRVKLSSFALVCDKKLENFGSKLDGFKKGEIH